MKKSFLIIPTLFISLIGLGLLITPNKSEACWFGCYNNYNYDDSYRSYNNYDYISYGGYSAFSYGPTFHGASTNDYYFTNSGYSSYNSGSYKTVYRYYGNDNNSGYSDSYRTRR